MLTLVAGCVRALSPFYTLSDLVFKKDLISTWQQPGKKTISQVAESAGHQDKHPYRLVLTNDEGHPATFRAQLMKLSDHLYRDLLRVDWQPSNNRFKHGEHYCDSHA